MLIPFWYEVTWEFSKKNVEGNIKREKKLKKKYTKNKIKKKEEGKGNKGVRC
jgi:transcription initiation factor IIE alpha subunit